MSEDQENAAVRPPTPGRQAARGSIGRALIIWAVLTVVFELLFWFISSNITTWQLLPPSAGDRSDEINSVMALFTVLSIPVFFMVVVFAFYSAGAWGARARPRTEGPAMLVNPRFITWWIAISLVLVTFLYIFGLAFLSKVDASPTGNVLQVSVDGEQWLWSYTYPQYGNIGASELELVVNRPTTFTISSFDVQHSFWIPAFSIKQDAVPGETTRISVTPQKLGNFEVRCAELCGLYHSYMQTPVHVVSQADFDAWVAKQQPSAAPTAASSFVPIQHATSAYLREPDRLVAGLARG